MERIVIAGLPTQCELTVLGQAFDCAWPVEIEPRFIMLLQAIDEADLNLGDRDPTNESPTH